MPETNSVIQLFRLIAKFILETLQGPVERDLLFLHNRLISS